MPVGTWREDTEENRKLQDELKIKQVLDLFTSHIIKRKIDPKAIKLKN